MAATAELQLVFSTKDLASSGIQGISASLRAVSESAAATRSGLNGLSGTLAGLGGGVITASAAIGVLSTALGAARDAMSAFLDTGKNSDMEVYETQFKVLLGSVDAAKQRMAELKQFNVETPFELDELVRASRLLEVVTDGALSTGEGLRLVGDMASAANAPIENVAMWVGRLYDGLQSGRPVGEATMRLQELGLMSGRVRNQIEALQKTGADGTAIWEWYANTVGQEVGGMMEELATTAKGVNSNLADAWNQGIVVPLKESVFEAQKLLGQDLLSALNSDQVKQAVQDMGAAMAQVAPYVVAGLRTIVQLIPVMFEYGANISQMFADGIIAGADMIINALNFIGDILTYWLKPGSPPKIVPDLDKWGAGAMEAYLEGWTDADFSIFDDLAKTIEGSLKTAVDSGKMDQMDLIPRLIGTKTEVANAIQQLRTTGTVAPDMFRRIAEAAGPANSSVMKAVQIYFDLAQASRETERAQRNLAVATADVERAQDDLNRITKEYDAALRPLQGQLDAVEAQMQQVRDAKRMAELQKIVDDDDTKEADRQLAILEMQEIQLRQQVDSQEAAAKAATQAAQDRVDAAEEEEKAQKKALDLAKATQKTMEDQASATDAQNKAMKEQADLTVDQQKLEEPEKEKKGKKGSGVAADMSLLENLPDVKTALNENIVGPFQEMEQKLSEIKGRLAPFGEAWTTLKDTVSSAVSGMSLSVLLGGVSMNLGLSSVQLEQFAERARNMRDAVLGAWGAIKDWGDENWGKIGNSIVVSMTPAKLLFDTIALLAVTLWQIAFSSLAGSIQIAMALISAEVSTVAALFNGDWSTALKNWGDVGKAVTDNFANALTIIGSKATDLTNILKGLWDWMTLVATAPEGSSGGGGGGGFRADGGPVTAGQRYIVGERGPEMFVPNTSGYIVPNHELNSTSVALTINYTGSAPLSDVETLSRIVIENVRDTMQRDRSRLR